MVNEGVRLKRYLALSLIVSQRLWQALAGLLTALVVTYTLNPDQQGWYYTFISLAALYALFEMGLSVALVQVTAHMFVKLNWAKNGFVVGDQAAAFIAFLSSSFKAYLKIAIAFIVVAILIGFAVFDHKVGAQRWALPWVALVMITAANMVMLPFFAVVEGSGEIAEVYAVRLIQGIFGSIVCWCVLLLGGGLWATIAIPLVGVAIAVVWLTTQRVGLIHSIYVRSHKLIFNWKSEIWPLQWRVGVGSTSTFLMSQLSTPILFHYQGAVTAGKMGLSLTIAHMLGIVAQSWIARRVPSMAQAASNKDWGALDQLFRKDFALALLIFIGGAIAFFLAYALLDESPYTQRVLSFNALMGLFGFVFFYLINGALASQLRSFRREPLAGVFLLGAILVLFGSVVAAKNYSAEGMVLVMFLMQFLLIFPISLYVWYSCNKKWRKEL